jgi:hypothetical protein
MNSGRDLCFASRVKRNMYLGLQYRVLPKCFLHATITDIVRTIKYELLPVLPHKLPHTNKFTSVRLLKRVHNDGIRDRQVTKTTGDGPDNRDFISRRDRKSFLLPTRQDRLCDTSMTMGEGFYSEVRTDTSTTPRIIFTSVLSTNYAGSWWRTTPPNYDVPA